jgi:hypothetical protein
MALRILLVLAAFAVLYSCGQESSPVERQEQAAGVERSAPAPASDQQAQDAALQTYLDQMSTLPIDKDLGDAQTYATVPVLDLSRADLTYADLSGANLSHATGKTGEQLDGQASSLEGVIMPNGQKYEEWLKSEGRGEDGENSGSS